MPPPGLLRLGGELLRRGIDVELEDLAFRQARGELANGSLMSESAARILLRRGEHEVIGLSIMGATLPAALEITRRLRELRPEVKLLIGGPGTTGCAEIILARFPWIDAVVQGEAEHTLPELLGRYDEGHSPAGVTGVSWRDDKDVIHHEAAREMIADLEELAPYAWDLLPPFIEYKRISGESEGLTPIDSGRGCVYDCSFCTIGRYWSRRSRTLPAQRLVDEVHALEHIEGARNAYLCHDIFGADHAHAVAFCEGMIERGVRAWECRARVDHLDEELVQLMGRAGCYRVLLGVESAAPKVRALANKSQKEDLDVLSVVERCNRAGIRPILSLILGLPGEGPEELEESLALVAQAVLITDALISLHLPNPQPGCGLHESHGETARPIEGIPPDMAFGCGESAPEKALIAAHPDLFSTWALLGEDDDRQRYLARIAKHLPELLQRFPRTWELLRRARGETHLQLFDAWRDSQRDFGVFARGSEDALVADALKWEEAILSLDGVALDDETAEGKFVESRARLVHLRHDLPKVARNLADGSHSQAAEISPTTLAITVSPQGVRTDRIGADVTHILELLHKSRCLSELEALHPGIHSALEVLNRSGLVRFTRENNAPPSAR
ncbi:MAG: hypothetical protein ACI8X5_003027 [Planctomycetota bacterium]|jgi:hypothetical protein